ncbi:MAG: hypothetical protein CVV64_00115 [Candidatus Wallbacteria bacterium HGW-Wallbacteria-1]|jgi:hypothetical protein|uniref:Radical SAM core domain-containing protein n=1 Tax=Candidatus Wallbacteria bacterium HGW-Wallbacteria-1 TaxID=2013854 RepID=A0A2N1PU64_9BACT|nr:MAG: hypothetical protein CVV64_00115 [Candidatus Wallbacteria bacterium HGW-Wallbacteria-1]
MNQLHDHSYFKMTRGMCPRCRSIVDAVIFQREGSVFQKNRCPDCDITTETMIAEDSEWYFRNADFSVKSKSCAGTQTDHVRGCPHDCGLCPWHEGGPNLPVFSITNACDLRCPICFTYNREDKIYYMTREEMQETVDFLLETRSEYDLINITGGEPTLHPDLEGLLEIAGKPGFGRITINSNGLRISRDDNLVEMLARHGAYVILSFDTLDPETSVKIHGRDIVAHKLRALDRMARANIGVTLLHVMIRGVNDHESWKIIELATRYSNVRSVTIQNMTFTGQGGQQFQPRLRLTLDMAARILEESSDSKIRREHFFPLPSAHPLCYNVAYFFRNRSSLTSFTDLISVDEIMDLIGDNYIIHPDEKFQERFNQAIAEAWSRDSHPELLAFLKTLLCRMYPSDGSITPFERQKIGEESILTVYLHAHMDEENFDLSRIIHCSDLVPVDGERLIPACAYNLFYRMKDEKFWMDESSSVQGDDNE